MNVGDRGYAGERGSRPYAGLMKPDRPVVSLLCLYVVGARASLAR